MDDQGASVDEEMERRIQEGIQQRLVEQDRQWRSPEFPAAQKVSSRYSYPRMREQLLQYKAQQSGFAHRVPQEDRRESYVRDRESLLAAKAAGPRWAVRRYVAPMMNKAVGAVAKSRPKSSHSAGGTRESSVGSTYSTASAPAPMSPGLSPSVPRRLRLSLPDYYAFAGMHHMVAHPSAVSCAAFSRRNREVLAYGCGDGSVNLLNAGAQPHDLAQLPMHRRPVTDLDWSLDGDTLVSCSLDRALHVFRVSENGRALQCVRSLRDESALHCARFHPTNANLLLFGNEGCRVHQYNLSTGRVSTVLAHSAPVTALAFDLTGDVVYVGDSTGAVAAYAFDPGRPLRWIDALGSLEGPVSSLQYKLSVLDVDRGLVLAAARSGRLALWEVGRSDEDGSVHRLLRALNVPARSSRIRAALCPMLRTSVGVAVVVGGDDGLVHIVNMMADRPPVHRRLATASPSSSRTGSPSASPNRGRSKSAAASSSSPASIHKSFGVNDLAAHNAPVLDVSWNQDESLLASADSAGILILWKRTPILSPDVRVLA